MPTGARLLDGITVRAAEVHRRLAADVPADEIAAARELLRRVIDEVRRQQEGWG
ncbi:hypothetical protein ACFZAV_24870 [Streptomyces sp. NPDC008343]|uniref:hypothetical protein n=1 Tax=Streptomyces sp. NPDC008343 TaxID=3364828 RepID=UPI0036E8751F